MAAIAAATLLTACISGGTGSRTAPPRSDRAPTRSSAPAPFTGIHKIRHIVVIMQENRSFDNYFGTFPGADGIPMKDGKPTVCVPNPLRHVCVAPYADHADINRGGPHDFASERRDVARGKMNGFITSFQHTFRACRSVYDPNCALATSLHKVRTDVVGYHTGSDLPNYWTYAKDFVLQDHMFEPIASWSLPSHVFEVSGWSAKCTKRHVIRSCTNSIDGQDISRRAPHYAWTDLTYLLHAHHVSWGYFVVSGAEPDCSNPASISCARVPQHASTPSIWNPLPYFDTVRHDRQLGNITTVGTYYAAARAGTLPAVSWVVPSQDVSEHPPARISAGVAYVTSLINAVMSGPDWNSTAIFLSWDDWGGFYDNAVPPKVDKEGYGMRVPGLVISPYAKRGYIDHQVLSFDAYLKFIEDDFLGGQRIDPKTDGRPDPRPDVREHEPILGDLANDFDFNRSPRPPMLLPVHPKTTLTG